MGDSEMTIFRGRTQNVQRGINVTRFITTFIWLAAAILMLLSASWPAIGQDRTLGRLDTAEITRNFLAVAVQGQSGGPHEARIRKWTKPIMVTVLGDVSEGYRSSVRIYARELGYLSNHSIVVSDEYARDDGTIILSKLSGGAANYIILFSDGSWAQFFERYKIFWERQYSSQIFEQTRAQRQKDNADCFAHVVEANTPGTIRAAFVYIRTSLADDAISACIVQEMAQSLGLTNASDTVRYSMFKRGAAYPQLTDQDKLFVKVLYDSRIEAGMTEVVAAPIVETIVKEIKGK